MVYYVLFFSSDRLTAKECLQHPWITGSLSASSSLSTVVGSVSTEQNASGSTISLSNHSIHNNEHKSMVDSLDSSHGDTSTENSKMVTSDSKSSVSSDVLNSENQTGKSDLTELTSDKESISLEMGDSEVLNPVCDSKVLDEKQNLSIGREIDDTVVENKTKELLNQNEKEIHMDTKSEAQSNIDFSHSNMELSHSEVEISHSNMELSHNHMEISFTQEDLANKISDRTRGNICDSKNISEQNICSSENKNTNVEYKTASENKSTFIKGKNTSSGYVENMSKLYNSVEIIVKNDEEDMEMTSPGMGEINLQSDSSDVDKTVLESFSKGNNSYRFNFDDEENETSASSSVKLSENPHKRGMCNDSIPSVVTPVNSNETDDGIKYEFISVSKRVRNYEQALTPQRSPQISPKSPRSPRIARLQRRNSHNNPYSS